MMITWWSFPMQEKTLIYFLWNIKLPALLRLHHYFSLEFLYVCYLLGTVYSPRLLVIYVCMHVHISWK